MLCRLFADKKVLCQTNCVAVFFFRIPLMVPLSSAVLDRSACLALLPVSNLISHRSTLLNPQPIDTMINVAQHREISVFFFTHCANMSQAMSFVFFLRREIRIVFTVTRCCQRSRRPLRNLANMLKKAHTIGIDPVEPPPP